MIRRDQIIATTHVDRQGERILLSGLESLVEMAKRSYVPVIIDHDPRSAPVGRLAEARIEETVGGQYALVATYEIFEPGVRVKSVPGREIPTRTYDHGQVQLTFDRSYRDEESLTLIGEISALLGSAPEEEGKKALEPMSVLLVGAAVGFGAVATGFLNALGTDAYQAVKAKLKKLCVPQRGEHDEQLLRFEFAVSQGSKVINVDVIFTNPHDDDVDYALGPMLQVLDEQLPGLFTGDSGIRRVVYEAADGCMTLKFAVRWDAVPLFPSVESGQLIFSQPQGKEDEARPGIADPDDESNAV